MTTYRFLFWPKGHGKVKSQSFPEYTVPHVEFYTGTTGGAIPADKLAKLTKTGALACTAPSAAVILVPTPAKASLTVAITGQSVASAVMSGTGSELQYDKSMCKPAKAPK